MNQFTDDKFKERFRLPKPAVEYLINILNNDLKPSIFRPLSLTVEEKVVAALRYFASGSFQTIVGDSYNISQSSSSRIIKVSLTL